MDAISQGQQAIFDQGHNVGKLAQKLFPGGMDASYELPQGFMKSMNKTKELIKNGQTVIYEAGLMANQTHCFADILVKENNKYKIYEVKSSSEVKDIHLYDAAFQYYVAKNYGLEISDISIVYLNTKYVKIGEIDVKEIFIVESVFDQILQMQNSVVSLLSQETEALNKPEAPTIEIGTHCFDPYDCSFLGHCWKDVPDYSVFNISRLSIDKKFDLYRKGITKTSEIPENYPLNTNQFLQVQSDKTGENIIDKNGIKEFLNKLDYPLYFLDFETFNPAIPLYDFSTPYQQIVFQYSLHILDKPGGKLIHKEFLANNTGDPRISMMKRLIKDIGPNGDIIVYNKGFETARLKEIAKNFPVFESNNFDMLDRIADLMIPFQQKLYYTPEMKGKYSIKNVLPALVPRFSYADLEINNGGDASVAFANLLLETDPQTINKTRENLLEYCKLDTLAMVEILNVLYSI